MFFFQDYLLQLLQLDIPWSGHDLLIHNKYSISDFHTPLPQKRKEDRKEEKKDGRGEGKKGREREGKMDGSGEGRKNRWKGERKEGKKPENLIVLK